MRSVKLHIIAMILVIVGGLNWGLAPFNLNLVELLGQYTSKHLSNTVYILVALSALYLLVDRDTYLPFLGKSAFPGGLLNPVVPKNSDTFLTINTKPNTKIVYWASEPGSDDRDYKEAYSSYKNSGVSLSDVKGVAYLNFRKPSGYNVPSGSLKPHVHYREYLKDGLMGEVKTISL